MKCKRGLEVQVLKSNAGYYIGTLTEDGFPNCRITRSYSATEEDARSKLLLDRQIGCIENEFCNGGKGCF